MSERTKRGRRRPNAILDIANALLTLIVIGIVVAGGLLFYGAQQFYARGPAPEDTAFLVEQGNGFSTIASRLAEQKLIDNSYVFRAGAWVMKKDARILPGEYRVAAGASMADILEEITSGKPVEYFVTVPEGETSFQVASRINDPQQALSGAPVPLPAEGSILPQRYDYFPRATRQSVLDAMQAEMKEAVAEVWAGCDPEVCGEGKPVETPEQLVTLASIVERETGIATERGEVAAVFINRLRRGMRLQSDPTIIYGITKGESVLGRGLRRSEIEEETPYNTYQIDGLPPGPIANPGIDALKAVANPPESDNLYFVAKGADPSDGHLFAATYAEHQRNVAQYRRAEQQEADEAKAALEAAEAAESGEDVEPEEPEGEPAEAPAQ